MVFSIFGRKKGAASPKPAEKGLDDKKRSAKAPAASVPAKPTTSAKPAAPASSRAEVEAGDETSLDFSTYAPQPRLEPASIEAAGRSSLAPPKEAQPASEGVGSVVEQAAILFANGQSEEALALLSRSVREVDLGESALQVWLMLFDLYQHLGMRPELEALGLEFAVKFERSPPAWIESEPRPDPALDTGGMAHFSVSGTLSGASAAGIEKLRTAAAKLRSIRVDFGKLQGLDGPGCGLLRQALSSIRAAGTEIVLSGESQLTHLLEEACQPGRTGTDGAVWALLLDVYRMLGDKDKFEETAVNYAVTFEMSPPSWETQVDADATKRAIEDDYTDASEQSLVLSGEITGAEASLAKRLQDWAAVYKMLVIDMSRVRRVDFVSAGLMLNVLTKLSQAGMTIQVRGPNALVHALLRVMRVDKVARIIPRK